MSGFAIVFNLDGGPADPDLLEPMLRASAHRASGKRASFCEGPVAAVYQGHPRQSQGGVSGLHVNEDTVVLVEGRIWNTPDLARRIGVDNIRGPAHALAAAYRRWGDDAPAHLSGQFAGVIINRAERRLLLIRDPVGVEPLHFALRAPCAVVASDAVQVRACPGADQDLDETALAGWALGTPNVDQCLFRGIEPVRRGQTVSIASGRTQRTRYWSPDRSATIRYRRETDYAEHLASLLEACVADRLGTSDDTLGVELSGGMDSTTVAAVAGRQLENAERELHACTLQFKATPEADETALAGDVAAHLGLRWTVLDADANGALDFPLGHQPLLESPAIFRDPTLDAVCSALRAGGVTRLLTGNGGDEVMGGSNLHFAHRLMRGDLGAVSDILGFCHRYDEPVARNLYTLLVEPLAGPRLDRWIRRAFGKPTDFRPAWVPRAALARSDLNEHYAPWSPSSRRHMVRDDLLDTFMGSGLVHVTQTYGVAAEPAGIAVEHPLADQRLLEFALAIPPDLLARGDHNKWLLRQTMTDRLPASVCWRAEKTAFGKVFAHGLGAQREYIDRALGHSLMADLGLIDTAALKRTFWETYNHTASLDMDATYCVLSLQHWLTTHFPERSHGPER